jgi:large subunit ribosomal protein L32
MPEPAKHPSRSKSRRRKAHIVLKKKNLVKCSNCGAMILPHRLCFDCGFYKGRLVLSPKTKEKKKKRK